MELNTCAYNVCQHSLLQIQIKKILNTHLAGKIAGSDSLNFYWDFWRVLASNAYKSSMVVLISVFDFSTVVI